MAKKTLEELENELHEAFDKAVARGNPRRYTDAASAMTAIGTIAQAIVAVEREKREREEAAQRHPRLDK